MLQRHHSRQIFVINSPFYLFIFFCEHFGFFFFWFAPSSTSDGWFCTVLLYRCKCGRFAPMRIFHGSNSTIFPMRSWAHPSIYFPPLTSTTHCHVSCGPELPQTLHHYCQCGTSGRRAARTMNFFRLGRVGLIAGPSKLYFRAQAQAARI